MESVDGHSEVDLGANSESIDCRFGVKLGSIWGPFGVHLGFVWVYVEI